MNKPQKLKLKGEQLFTHYAFLVILLAVPVFNMISVIQILIGRYEGVRNLTDHLVVSLPFVVLGVIFCFRQNQRLYFKEYKIAHTDRELQEAIRMTADQLNWTIGTNNKGYLRAFRDGEGFDWWGQMITIVYDNNTILINSISDPNIKPTFTSLGWDRKNVKAFIKNLETIKRKR
jgi:hypothetical protein